MRVALWLLCAGCVVTVLGALAAANRRVAMYSAVVGTFAFLLAIDLSWLAFLLAITAVITELFRRRWVSAGIWGGVAFVTLTLAALFAPASNSSSKAAENSQADATPIMQMTPAPDPYSDCIDDHMSKAHCAKIAKAQGYRLTSDDKSLQESTPEPTATPEPPTPKPTTYDQYVHEQKAEFLQGVDESISGAMIAGNKLKYVGDSVDLHCTVVSVIDDSQFNAECGTDDDGMPAIIVIEYGDSSSLDKGQAVRILGTVDEPMEGENGFGGETTFPTVKAEYME